MIDRSQLGALFAGLRAAVTIADQDGRIVFLNDLAAEHYADQGGTALVGASLYDCHNRVSQTKIRQLYTRYRGGEMTSVRYHEEGEVDLAKSVVLLPIVSDDQFRGIAELIWSERRELVFEL